MRGLQHRAAAALLLGTVAAICVSDPAAAKSWRDRNVEIEKLKADLVSVKREMAKLRSKTERGSPASFFLASVVVQPPEGVTIVRVPPVVAIPDMPSGSGHHVFPQSGYQKGQWGDRRRGHIHAGIDIAGKAGDPVVATYKGTVIPSPGGDRGYGPLVVMLRGDDGIVYRYAHLATKTVHPGAHVSTGQKIGTVGIAGGLPHTHFEAIPLAQYRSRPYGFHSFDPNIVLGGSRGLRMVAGALAQSTRLAAYLSGSLKVAEIVPTKIKRRKRYARKSYRKARHYRRADAGGIEISAASRVHPHRGYSITCVEVRSYVAQYGRAMVEQIARQSGATDDDIQRALRCFKGRRA